MPEVTSSDHPLPRHLEAERMHDVHLLLEHLIRNEEITVAIIIDCLYDIGSVNLINQKFPRRPVNGVMKWIARFSKPVFRIVALRWVKRNCPRLVTNWLHKKVAFKNVEKQVQQIKEEVAAAEISEVKTQAELEAERLSTEVRQLRSQVRVASGVAITAIVALSGMMVWLAYDARFEFWQPAQKARTTAVERLTH